MSGHRDTSRHTQQVRPRGVLNRSELGEIFTRTKVRAVPGELAVPGDRPFEQLSTLETQRPFIQYLNQYGDQGGLHMETTVRAGPLIGRPRFSVGQGPIDSTTGALFRAPGTTWVRITGHGSPRPERVGFGDDAAVPGGLVAWDEQGPVFAGDAIADPLAGMVSAVATLACLPGCGSALVDVSLAEVSAYAASIANDGSSTDVAQVRPPHISARFVDHRWRAPIHPPARTRRLIGAP